MPVSSPAELQRTLVAAWAELCVSLTHSSATEPMPTVPIRRTAPPPPPQAPLLLCLPHPHTRGDVKEVLTQKINATDRDRELERWAGKGGVGAAGSGSQLCTKRRSQLSIRQPGGSRQYCHDSSRAWRRSATSLLSAYSGSQESKK